MVSIDLTGLVRSRETVSVSCALYITDHLSRNTQPVITVSLNAETAFDQLNGNSFLLKTKKNKKTKTHTLFTPKCLNNRNTYLKIFAFCWLLNTC